MRSVIKLLDTVAVTSDIPSLGLTEGEVGAVVEIHPTGAVEVEFVDEKGQTYALSTLDRSQVVPLHQRGRTLQLHVA